MANKSRSLRQLVQQQLMMNQKSPFDKVTYGPEAGINLASQAGGAISHAAKPIVDVSGMVKDAAMKGFAGTKAGQAAQNAITEVGSTIGSGIGDTASIGGGIAGQQLGAGWGQTAISKLLSLIAML